MRRIIRQGDKDWVDKEVNPSYHMHGVWLTTSAAYSSIATTPTLSLSVASSP